MTTDELIFCTVAGFSAVFLVETTRFIRFFFHTRYLTKLRTEAENRRGIDIMTADEIKAADDGFLRAIIDDLSSREQSSGDELRTLNLARLELRNRLAA